MPYTSVHKSLLRPLTSFKALFEVFGMRNALEVLKIYLFTRFGGIIQAEIHFCGLRVRVDHRNVKELVELSRKLEHVIKAGGKVYCCQGHLYIDLNGKYLCRLSRPKIAIDDVLTGPLLGVTYETEEYMMMKEVFSHILELFDPKEILFVDVGSYIGGYAVRACKHGFKVIAIEPHPSNYLQLTRNLKINRCDYIALNVAAGKDFGEAYLCEEESLTSSYIDIVPRELRARFRTKIIPLKEVLPKDKKFIVKIDVEGKEIEVLGGMNEELDNTLFLLIEVGEKNLAKVINYLKGYNMKLVEYVLHYGAPTRYQREAGFKYFNMLFINTKALPSKLRNLLGKRIRQNTKQTRDETVL
jgi:FkbM family methyltransferase